MASKRDYARVVNKRAKGMRVIDRVFETAASKKKGVSQVDSGKNASRRATFASQEFDRKAERSAKSRKSK